MKKVYILDDDPNMTVILRPCFSSTKQFELVKIFYNHIDLLKQLEQDEENGELPYAIIYDVTLTASSQGIPEDDFEEAKKLLKRYDSELKITQQGVKTNGFEVAKIVSRRFRNIKRLVYSADMAQSGKIEKAINADMHGIIVRNNLKSCLIKCLQQTAFPDENPEVPALCKNISPITYSNVLLKLYKNLNLENQFEKANLSWGGFLAIAKGYSNDQLVTEGIYKKGAERQMRVSVFKQLNIAIQNDPNQERWDFIPDSINNRTGIKKKNLNNAHVPIIAILLKVKPIVNWYEKKFGVKIHY